MADPAGSTASGDPRRLAVLGSPIGHSLSPALHAAAYTALGLPWQYGAADVAEGALGAFLDTLGPDWRGLSLTMPLKHEIIPFLADLDRVASLTGAVNTVLFDEDPADGSPRRLTGFNTDVPGLVRALAEAGTDRAAHVTVVGAGATAASAVATAAELGAESVEIIARTPARAEPLGALARQLGLTVAIHGLDALPDPARQTDLVLSTLPGGVSLPGEFALGIRASVLLFDVGYAPWPSALARSWADAGGQSRSGLTMLLHQALVQVRIFVGGDPFEPLPDEDSVLRQMRAALPESAAPVRAVEG